MGRKLMLSDVLEDIAHPFHEGRNEALQVPNALGQSRRLLRVTIHSQLKQRSAAESTFASGTKWS